MKIIRYRFLTAEINHGTEENPDVEQILLNKEIRCYADCLEANEEIAKAEAYMGEYTIEDDGEPVVEAPTWQDRIEAQVTYTAIITDSLLEEV